MPSDPKAKRPARLAPRKQPRQERARITRDAVIIAAERILDVEGPAALTTSRIAEAAGVSVGSIYQYFPSKQAIIAGLIDHFLDRYHAVFTMALDAVRDLPLQTVGDAIARGFIDMYRRHARAHFPLYEYMTGLGMTRVFESQLAIYVEETARFLAGRQDVDVGDPHAAAFAIVHACEGVARAIATSSVAIDDEAIARATVAMLVRYASR